MLRIHYVMYYMWYFFCTTGMYSIVGCGVPPVTKEISSAPWYKEEDVRLAMVIVSDLAKEEFPTIVEDIDSYGWKISFQEEAVGPAESNGNWLRGTTQCGEYRNGEWVVGQVKVMADDECLAYTALAHELIHFVGCVEGKPLGYHDGLDHQPPYFSLNAGMDFKSTWEWKAQKQLANTLCPGRNGGY